MQGVAMLYSIGYKWVAVNAVMDGVKLSYN